ncbi:MAG TPA: hypothetical protein VM598_02115 [Bdellovibrionota bacterium]|nr:hypothetical protein [Bdellovibrionota bacterium]
MKFKACSAGVVLGLILLAPQGGKASVVYETIVGDSGGGREMATIHHLGIGTSPSGEAVLEIYTSDSPAPRCSAEVGKAADALELVKTIREYLTSSRQLKVWCTQFREPAGPYRNFINFVFPNF